MAKKKKKQSMSPSKNEVDDLLGALHKWLALLERSSTSSFEMKIAYTKLMEAYWWLEAFDNL